MATIKLFEGTNPFQTSGTKIPYAFQMVLSGPPSLTYPPTTNYAFDDDGLVTLNLKITFNSNGGSIVYIVIPPDIAPATKQYISTPVQLITDNGPKFARLIVNTAGNISISMADVPTPNSIYNWINNIAGAVPSGVCTILSTTISYYRG